MALALCTTACAPAVGKWVDVDPVARALRVALTDLQAVPGLRITGSTGGATVDLRVTGAGEAVGSVVRGGKRADVLVVDGKSYVRGGKEYWGTLDPRGEVFAGKWVESDDRAVGFPVQQTLAPATLAQGLRADFVKEPEPGAGSGPPAESTIDGVRAWRASIPGGDLYVSAERPHRILRIDAPLTGEDGSGVTDRVRFDVKPETEDSAADVISSVGLGMVQLARSGAYNAGVQISFVGKLTAPCNASGCNVSAVVKNESAAATVDVVLTAKVTSGSGLLASCASIAKPVAPARTAPLACHAGGASWRTFYQRATRPSRAPTTTPYLVRAVATAKAKPPASAMCSLDVTMRKKTTPLPPCPPPTITDQGLEHSWKHAKEWWGRSPTEADRAAWRGMIETAQQSTKTFPWSANQLPTTAHLARIGGRYFVAQFDRETGKLVTAFGPNSGQVRAMLKLLSA